MDLKNLTMNRIFIDRYKRFINKVKQFAVAAKSNKEIDNSPDGIFDGSAGDSIVKKSNNIYYRQNSDADYTLISDQFSEITKSTAYVLSQGINKNASWIKTSSGTYTWKLLGYFCPIVKSSCCAVSGSIEPIVPVTPNISLTVSKNVAVTTTYSVTTLGGQIDRNGVTAALASYSVQYKINNEDTWQAVSGLSNIVITDDIVTIPSTIHILPCMGIIGVSYRVRVVDVNGLEILSKLSNVTLSCISVPQVYISTNYGGATDPNGVVTAMAGSTYYDLSMPTSPVLWVKGSGEGNTGWI